jgi:metal-responsive CopG/Arc/MetJ family transcriptional regulator
MTATVRLDENLVVSLNRVSKALNKKKSDLIRDAITFYIQNIEENKKSRLLKAVEKTKDQDKKEFKDFQGAIDDGI